jgi:hypothetical protein
MNRECKDPHQSWFCLNETCQSFLGKALHSNVSCWHFCSSCISHKENIQYQGEYVIQNIVSCSDCQHNYCKSCTYFYVNHNDNRCLTCQCHPPLEENYDDISNTTDYVETLQKDLFPDELSPRSNEEEF